MCKHRTTAIFRKAEAICQTIAWYLLFSFLSLSICMQLTWITHVSRPFAFVDVYLCSTLYLKNYCRDKQSKTRLDYITLDNVHHFLFVVVSAWVTVFDMHLQHNALQMHKASHVASLPRQMRDEPRPLGAHTWGQQLLAALQLKIKKMSQTHVT